MYKTYILSNQPKLSVNIDSVWDLDINALDFWTYELKVVDYLNTNKTKLLGIYINYRIIFTIDLKINNDFLEWHI